MGNMFWDCNEFNQPIGDWDTARVTNMKSMFHVATAFSQDLSSWCVERISSEPTQFGNSGTDPLWGYCQCAIAEGTCEALTDDNIMSASDLWFSNETVATARYVQTRARGRTEMDVLMLLQPPPRAHRPPPFSRTVQARAT
jgi:surface protein